MSLAEALAAIVLITLQLTIAHSSGMQVELLVASFLDQASLHPSEEIWFQKPRQKPPDKTRVTASRGLSSHSIARHLQRKELNHQGKRGRSAVVSKSDKRNQKQTFQIQFLPSSSRWLVVVLMASIAASSSIGLVIHQPRQGKRGRAQIENKSETTVNQKSEANNDNCHGFVRTVFRFHQRASTNARTEADGV